MKNETGIITHNLSKKGYLSLVKQFTALQSKKSTRQYTTIILSFAALIIFGVFAINPTLTTIVQLQKQLEDSRLLDSQLDEKIQNIETLRREYELIKADLPLLSDAIPVSPNTPTLIGQIQTLISENNLTIDQIQTEKIPYTKDGLPSGELGAYVVTFNVNGAYSDINEFAKAAVAFDRVVTISQISIFRDQQDPTRIKGTADVKAYFDQKTL